MPTQFSRERARLESVLDVDDAADQAAAQRALADLLLDRAVQLRQEHAERTHDDASADANDDNDDRDDRDDRDDDALVESEALFEQARSLLARAELLVGVDGAHVQFLRQQRDRDDFEALTREIQTDDDLDDLRTQSPRDGAEDGDELEHDDDDDRSASSNKRLALDEIAFGPPPRQWLQ